MKKLLLVRVALLLAVAATAFALVGGRVSSAAKPDAAKPARKTEVVALEVAKRVPVRHARCRSRAGI